MLENMFTTKMSMDKKKLQNRFSKIRSKNGRLSKLMAIIIFAVLISIIVCASVYVAVKVNKESEYAMSDADFEAYVSRPIGAVMASLDYVDNEKLVFHYLEGFFIIDQQSYEIKHKIDLRKLNSAQHSQGDTTLMVMISDDGKYAYLTSEGTITEAEKFDKYIINLDSGEVEIGEMPEGTPLFAGYADISTINPIEGWNSTRCIKNGDRTYYLNYPYGAIGNIQLVTINNKANDNTNIRYVFGNEYISEAAKKDQIIHGALAEGEEILVNSGMSWSVDAQTVRGIINKLCEIMNLKKIDVEDGDYEVLIYATVTETNGGERLYILDKEDGQLIFSVRLDLTGYAGMKEYYTELMNILKADKTTESELYKKTAKFLESEFHRVFDPYYDIQKLSISSWKQDGNEATFYYKMEYLNYNRDPDKAEYIQEAKKRSQSEYETLYNDYLALKEGNHQFKIVWSDKGAELYSNVAPKGTEWQRVRIDDYISGE